MLHRPRPGAKNISLTAKQNMQASKSTFLQHHFYGYILGVNLALLWLILLTRLCIKLVISPVSNRVFLHSQ